MRQDQILVKKTFFKNLQLEPVKEPCKEFVKNQILTLDLVTVSENASFLSVINLILAYISDHSVPFHCRTISLILSLITVIFL